MGANSSRGRTLVTITSRAGAVQKLRPDFFLRHQRGYWDVVELKGPNLRADSLAVGSATRPRFSHEVYSAVGQIRIYLEELAKPEIQKRLDLGITVARPIGFVIAGRDQDLSVTDRRRLEADLARDVRLFTYDDPASLAGQRKSIVTTYHYLPLIQGNGFLATRRNTLTDAKTLLDDTKRFQYITPPWEKLFGLLVRPLREFDRESPSASRSGLASGSMDWYAHLLNCLELKKYVRALRNDWGCDLEETGLDVPHVELGVPFATEAVVKSRQGSERIAAVCWYRRSGQRKESSVSAPSEAILAIELRALHIVLIDPGASRAR